MNVSVAIIVDANQRVLITQRAMNAPHGGFWEFPGGKIEAGETAAEALIREVKEEVGLDVQRYVFWDKITHTYDAKTVTLWLYYISEYVGEAACCEAQMDLRWVPINELHRFQFPAANMDILGVIHKNLEVTAHPTVKILANGQV